MINPIKNSTVKRASKGMLKLALGSGGSKLITLLSLAVLTRLYQPNDFGALSVFTSLVVTLAPLVTFQFNQAIPLPRHDAMAINVACLTFMLMTLCTGLIAVALFLFAPVVLPILSMDALIPFWWLIAVGIFAYAAYSVVKMWATRSRAFGVMAKAEIMQSATGNLVKILYGINSAASPVGLLVGQVLSQSGGFFALFSKFIKDINLHFKRITFRRIRFSAYHYRKFLFFRTPSQVLLILSAQSPVLIISALYGASAAGQFGLATMSLSMPMNLIGRNMASAYFGEISRLGKRAGPEIRESVISLTKILGLIGFLLAIAIFLLGPIVFPFVFGVAWQDAGHFASILSIYLAVQFVAAPITNVLSVFRRDEIYLQLDGQRMLLVCMVFGLSFFYELTIAHALIIYSVALSMHYGIMFLRVLACIPKHNNVDYAQ